VVRDSQGQAFSGLEATKSDNAGQGEPRLLQRYTFFRTVFSRTFRKGSSVVMLSIALRSLASNISKHHPPWQWLHLFYENDVKCAVSHVPFNYNSQASESQARRIAVKGNQLPVGQGDEVFRVE
jgi:hypothetical protein